MAYVIAAPEMMTSTASDLAAIGSNVDAAHMVAAARTTSVIPAAADEVSAGIAHLFSQHAANYQALAGQAAAFNDQFVQHTTAGAFSYADIEAAIASFLQDLRVNADQVLNSLGLPDTTRLAEGALFILLVAFIIFVILAVAFGFIVFEIEQLLRQSLAPFLMLLRL